MEGLTYILLTCSNCATQHSDKGVPLVGVRVVGVSHPSLNDRLNQVPVECRHGLSVGYHLAFHSIAGVSATVSC